MNEIDKEVLSEFAIGGKTVTTPIGEWKIEIVNAQKTGANTLRTLQIDLHGPRPHNLTLQVTAESLKVNKPSDQQWILDAIAAWLIQPDSEKKPILRI